MLSTYRVDFLSIHRNEKMAGTISAFLSEAFADANFNTNKSRVTALKSLARYLGKDPDTCDVTELFPDAKTLVDWAEDSIQNTKSTKPANIKSSRLGYVTGLLKKLVQREFFTEAFFTQIQTEMLKYCKSARTERETNEMPPKLRAMGGDVTWEKYVQFEADTRPDADPTDVQLFRCFRAIGQPRRDNDYSLIYVVDTLPVENPKDGKNYAVVNEEDCFVSFRKHKSSNVMGTYVLRDEPVIEMLKKYVAAQNLMGKKLFQTSVVGLGFADTREVFGKHVGIQLLRRMSHAGFFKRFRDDNKTPTVEQLREYGERVGHGPSETMLYNMVETEKPETENQVDCPETENLETENLVDCPETEKLVDYPETVQELVGELLDDILEQSENVATALVSLTKQDNQELVQTVLSWMVSLQNDIKNVQQVVLEFGKENID